MSIVFEDTFTIEQVDDKHFEKGKPSACMISCNLNDCFFSLAIEMQRGKL